MFICLFVYLLINKPKIKFGYLQDGNILKLSTLKCCLVENNNCIINAKTKLQPNNC